MKAKIENNTYTITIEGKRSSGFKKESEWEGFVKYSNDKGSVIVSNGDLIDSIFGDDEKEVVACSPCFQGKISHLQRIFVIRDSGVDAIGKEVLKFTDELALKKFLEDEYPRGIEKEDMQIIKGVEIR